MKHSKSIELFLNLINNIEKENEVSKENLENEDKLTQDILHKLELEETSAIEKVDLATQLVENRRRRRGYKNTVELNKCLVEWLDNNKKSAENLKQTLGKIRKVEEYHENRVYKPKVVN